MKKLLLTLTIATTIFATSCKKKEGGKDEYKLGYTIQCAKCTIEMDGNNGKTATESVSGNETFTYRSTRNNVKLIAKSDSYVSLSVTVNDELVYSASRTPVNGKAEFLINTTVR